jgi:hypothetical protein
VPREHAVQTPNLVIRPLVDAPCRTQYFVTRVTPYEAPVTRTLRAYVLSRAWLGSRAWDGRTPLPDRKQNE